MANPRRRRWGMPEHSDEIPVRGHMAAMDFMAQRKKSVDLSSMAIKTGLILAETAF